MKAACPWWKRMELKGKIISKLRWDRWCSFPVPSCVLPGLLIRYRAKQLLLTLESHDEAYMYLQLDRYFCQASYSKTMIMIIGTWWPSASSLMISYIYLRIDRLTNFVIQKRNLSKILREREYVLLCLCSSERLYWIKGFFLKYIFTHFCLCT